MKAGHFTNRLDDFLAGGISKEEQQAIAEHLLLCDECRREHDQIKLGSSLAGRLTRSDAPDAVWANISDSLDGREESRFGVLPIGSGFSARKGFAFAVALVAVTALAGVVFISLFGGESPYKATRPNLNGSPGATNTETIAQQTNVNVQTDANSNINTNTNSAITPTDGFAVETLAGSPTIEGGGTNRIGVGQLLETDARSTARIAVADIGTVDVSPNSRIRLAETGKDEHRLSLERGKLHAKIYAPPRLFVVDTPSAKAVDLGCEYTLDVDKNGDSVLHVTGGWVALERDGRESIVPAGMMCKTRKSQGLGTPFNAEATAAFKKALDSFDFSRGGSAAVQAIIREAELYDMFTLWHLLSRVSKEDSGLIYDALADLVPPPAGVTREGILSKNKKMLYAWKVEVENAWFS